ncbi:MAG: serine acetyltransferase [Spirochaetaceae bacterium]|jgi:serine O-acetyltransferase|nr:serine acetyltransferase [Spirochaetaceae bacterium]
MVTTTVSRLKHLTELLTHSYMTHEGIIKIDSGNLLNRSRVIEIVEKLRSLIFPGYFGKKNISASSVEYYTGDMLEEVAYILIEQIAQALHHSSSYAGLGRELILGKADALCFEFLSRLPEVRENLAADVSAAYDGDPAADSLDEIISSYPGIYAITVYRLAHILYELAIPLIPRILTEHAHGVTGIDIHPGAAIGHHFFIDHGTGVVIGETTVIGNYVKIYQGVTLGGLSTRGGQTLKGVKRHPTIENHVTIYSGASILGGNTVIGEGVVIGSNAFVTKSIPEKTKVSVKNPELQYRLDDQRHGEKEEVDQSAFWDWVI